MKRLGLSLLGIVLILSGTLLAWSPPGLDQLDPSVRGSLRIEDRTGHLLRDVPVGGVRAHWVQLDDLPAWLPAAVIAAEDRRFAWHPGVDPLAVVRAAAGNLMSGRITSGGSTITMQLARLNSRRGPSRSLTDKVREALAALQLEQRLTKREILEQYLNRASFGRGTVGIESAARTWFGHPARTLSPSEATWLAVMPRAPARLSRGEALPEIESRRALLIERLGRSGRLDPETQRLASLRPAVVPRPAHPFEAPHLTDWLLKDLPPSVSGRAGRIVTTLDASMQQEIHRRIEPRLEHLSAKNARQVAIVVFHNETRELRAMIGSVDFFHAEAGQVNGALARRQPGSALKPFTYALAFESGMTPASLVDDVARDFPAAGGPFVPRNYGGQSFGAVRIREALAGSFNIAAVDALSKVGVSRLFARLVALDLLTESGRPEEGGLGLTLGVAEVRLVDLTNAYVTLASGGRHRPPVVLLEVADARGAHLPLPARADQRETQIIDPVAAWWVADILADDDARLRSFGRQGVLDMPWPVAVKTGTSSDWRDNWTLGFTREWTVGVWVGDFAGQPMHQVSGVFGAAPVLRDIFEVLSASGPLTALPRPAGLAPIVCCIESGAPAGPSCPGTLVEWLPEHRSVTPACRPHEPGGEVDPVLSATRSERRSWIDAPGIRVIHPSHHDVYFIDPALPATAQIIRLEAEAPTGSEVTWVIDGRSLARTTGPHDLAWKLVPGSHRLVVSIAGGAERAVDFTVAAGQPVTAKNHPDNVMK